MGRQHPRHEVSVKLDRIDRLRVALFVKPDRIDNDDDDDLRLKRQQSATNVYVVPSGDRLALQSEIDSSPHRQLILDGSKMRKMVPWSSSLARSLMAASKSSWQQIS
jgi:hypothetical protein